MNEFGKRKSLVFIGLTLLLALATVLLLAPVASASPPFSITKTDGQDTYVPGETITYTIVLTNNSPDDFDGIQLYDLLSCDFDSSTANWSIASEGGAAANPASGTGWTASSVITLPAGSRVILTFSAEVYPATTVDITNMVSATYPADADWPAGVEVTASDTNTLYKPPPLTVTKSDGQDTYQPGDTLTYQIVVTNTSAVAIDDVDVTDIYPPSHIDEATVTWTCTYGGGATGNLAATGSGNICDTVDFPAGGTATYVITCPVLPTAEGNLTNEAVIMIRDSQDWPGGMLITDSDTDTSGDETDNDYTTVSQIDTGAGAASGPGAGVWALGALALTLAGGIAWMVARPALRRR